MTLASAKAGARDLGPLDTNTRLRIVLGLTGQRSGEEADAIAAGQRVTEAQYDAEFGPRPATARDVVARLKAFGIQGSWSPGSALVRASGTVGSVERAFGVRIDRYARADGASFYGPTSAPHLSGVPADAVSSIMGLDDAQQVVGLDRVLRSSGSGLPGGYTPDQVLGAYHFAPLYAAGLDGSGQTIVFLEFDKFDRSHLARFTQAFGQAPISVTTSSDDAWGSPEDPSGEADMDLEIAHSVAPKAHLVVVYADSGVDDLTSALSDAVGNYPTAIFSISLGGCAGNGIDSGASAWDDVLKHLALVGGTALVSSGDQGAFTCTPGSSGLLTPSASSPADDPYATAVGGTSLFVGPDNSYQSEASWGSSMTQSGSGGGLSPTWRMPGYQAGSDDRDPYANGKRQLPDVAAVSDPTTGWDIYTAGGWDIQAGTSAGAPLWAGLMALTDQSARLHGVSSVGFANPIIYAIGKSPARYATAFHDITLGNNLFYPAKAGWDFATGWGSPDGAGFVDTYLSYRAHP
jgi:kumamolisin